MISQKELTIIRKLQVELDVIIYPPTHIYHIDGLVPMKDLAKRVDVIEREFPDFFKSGYLLDVGCNKGFFSLYHNGSVVGIDPDMDCVTLCRKLSKRSFYNYSFKQYAKGYNFRVNGKFDKIFIGNGHHYPFIEYGGWSFVKDLKRMCRDGGLVLLEGPTGMEGVDAQNCIPKKLATNFNMENLIQAFVISNFQLVKMVPSPLVDRHFLLFERVD